VCGIAGTLALDGKSPADPGVIAAMCAVQRHRGPDDEDTFFDGPLGFGFRRLAIVDLAGGRQPMHNEDGSLVLICNGEIYNAPQLRTELQARGHIFRSLCDVEVLLHLYEEVGEDFVHHLNGQFAAALYDRRRHRLVLARDPFGVCPLHYSVRGHTLVFASEIKAILCHPAVERRVDLTGLDQVLTFPGLVSPTTMFAGIRSLPNGHRAVVENGAVRIEPYWDLIYPSEGEAGPALSEAEWTHGLAERLKASMRRRLQADVPVGFYLSGGLDSSLIAALIAEAAPGVRRCAFSIGFPGREMDESIHQECVARHVGADHRHIAFDWREIVERIPAMIRHAECPLKESYNTCSLALSAAARGEGVPVILSGEGADELFAGYIGYRFDRFGRPGSAPVQVEEELEAELRARLWGDPALVYETDHLAYCEVKSSLFSQGVRAHYADFNCLESLPIERARLVGRHPVNRRSYLDFKLRLADHLVSDHGDRMAMAHSVEVRYPFLDLDVVELARQMPPDLKLKGWQEKYIVKRVAAGKVPETILAREKFGFHGPGSPYLLRHARDFVEDVLATSRLKRQGFFDPVTVEVLKRRYLEEDFQLNLPFETDLLFVVLTFSLFLDEFAMSNFC
jgi:asparagine synthase (glutamine-hydrolysing)